MHPLHTYAAIDPLAMMLPTSTYLQLVEKLHPNLPLIDSLRAVAKNMTAEEKFFVISGAKRVSEFAHAATSAVG
jgi:hypothetical protein